MPQSTQAPPSREVLLTWTLLALAYLVACIYAVGGESRGDELVHFQQVTLFRHGEFRVLGEALTTIPGYHAAIAAALWLVGAESLAAARALTGLFGVLAVIAFARLHRSIHASGEPVAVAQFAMLPLLAPFVFLVYTDVASLACVLWATLACVRSRHRLAAIIMVAAIGMRQNNVLWLAFLWPLIAWPLWCEQGIASWRSILRDSLPYMLPGSCFVAYWIWNGSVSYSGPQSSMHPDASLHVGNVYFMLFVAAFLLPLQCFDGLRRFRRDAIARPWLWLVPLGVLALYLGAFVVDHPYNLIENAVSLRNRVLQYTQNSSAMNVGFGLISSAAAIGLGWQRLVAPAARAVFPVAVLFVALSWLIEQRYYLIPMAMLLAWRIPLGRRAELSTLALWSALAVLFFWGMISGALYI